MFFFQNWFTIPKHLHRGSSSDMSCATNKGAALGISGRQTYPKIQQDKMLWNCPFCGLKKRELLSLYPGQRCHWPEKGLKKNWRLDVPWFKPISLWYPLVCHVPLFGATMSSLKSWRPWAAKRCAPVVPVVHGSRPPRPMEPWLTLVPEKTIEIHWFWKSLRGYGQKYDQRYVLKHPS